MSYLKAHIFVPFHCFVQVLFNKKIQCSVFTSVRLHYIAIYRSRAASLLTVSLRHYLFAMVFSKEYKKIIQSGYEEKRWFAYKMLKEQSSKNLTYTSVKRLFEDSGIEKKVLFELGQ